MYVSAKENHQEYAGQCYRGDRIGIEPAAGNQMSQPADVKQQEGHQQIEHDDQP